MKAYITLILLFIFSSCVKPVGAPPDELPDSFIVGTERTDFLIYGGPGSWKAEVNSLKKLIFSSGSTYQVLTPSQMNDLSIDDLLDYRAFIFVGGDAPTVRRSLATRTRSRIREAVQQHGLNYLGFCAGAWLAVAPISASGNDTSYGIGVINGPVLKPNHLSRQGRAYALDEAIFPDGSRRKLLWYGGPVTLTQSGTVVAKYSDGTPAISQKRSGRGFVIISGLHPAATRPMLNSVNLLDQEAVAPDFAKVLLDAALYGKELQTF